MLNVFYRALDIGIAALWMVIAVLILRLVFRKHLIQGSGYTGDILGELYVIFDYDITGRVLVRDLQFIPWYGDSEDVYYMISHSSEGKMKDFDGKQLIIKAY